MGEVYKARDPRLARDVALKVLAPDRAHDKDALARFEREAKTASALNHPIIVNIYEIGEAQTPTGATSYIAMEFVDGQTLRERLRSGVGWQSLVEPLAQVADALARAHQAGIVHRDLKPENIMITPDGYPKLLDFGLAKLMEPESERGADESDPTQSFDGRTKAGTILGTPGYMSPEQVQGKPLDHRSDIFSFGCILYEAATGRRPFKADSQVATLHAIVYDEPPPMESLNAAAPPELRRIVRGCLAKDPAQRYQAIKVVANDLRELSRRDATAGPDSAPTLAHTGATQATRRPPWRWLLAGTGLVVVPLGVWMQTGRRAAAPSRPPAAPLQVEKVTNRGRADNPALSPDGRYLAYSALADDRQAIFLRDLAEKTETRLAQAVQIEGVRAIRFAKDGRSLYCRLHERGHPTPGLYKVPLVGGEPRLLLAAAAADVSPDEKRLAFVRVSDQKRTLVVADVDGGGDERNLGELTTDLFSWSPDGSRLLFQRLQDGKPALFVVDAAGGAERRVGDAVGNCRWWRPDGASVLCLVASEGASRTSALVGVDLATGTSKRVGKRAWRQINGLQWLPDASQFVVSETAVQEGNALYLVSYPEGTVRRIPADTNSYWGLGMTPDGTRLVSVQDVSRSDLVVSSDPERGGFNRIASGTSTRHRGSWTPDGKLVYSSKEGGSYDLFIVDADGSNRRQLTSDPRGNEIEPAASPDGRYIVFVSDRTGIMRLYRINRDGSGLSSLSPEPTSRYQHHDPRFTPDSKWVIYRHRDNGSTLRMVPIDGGPGVQIKGERPATGGVIEQAFGASASPDGRSLAFLYFIFDTKVQPSRVDIAVATLDGRIVKRFPSHETYRGGISDDERVQWSRDGSALYYRRAQAGLRNVWKQPLAGGPPVQVTHFEEPVDYFDWSPDGKRLAVSRSSSLSDVVLITNFR
jgi:Tol biopolymer transport system component